MLWWLTSGSSEISWIKNSLGDNLTVKDFDISAALICGEIEQD